MKVTYSKAESVTDPDDGTAWHRPAEVAIELNDLDIEALNEGKAVVIRGAAVMPAGVRHHRWEDQR